MLKGGMTRETNASIAEKVALGEERLRSHEDHCAERYETISKTLALIGDQLTALKGTLFQTAIWVSGGVFATLIALIFFLIEKQ